MNEWLSTSLTYIQEHAVSWSTRLLLGVFVLLLGWLVSRIAANATARALRRGQARSLAPMMSTLVKLVIVVTAVVTALDQIGFEIAAVLAGAGVLGLAVGFGAQTLVKDCISGFFMVVQNVIEEGDWVDIDGKFGRVESVGLRITTLRAFDGTLWHIPNGEVKIVGNLCRGWVRVVIEVAVAYEADVAEGIRALQEVADEFAKEHADLIFADDPPCAQGILSLDDSSVGIRLIAKIKHDQEGALWGLTRALRRRVKEVFDAEGIEIPFPRSVVYHRQEENRAA